MPHQANLRIIEAVVKRAGIPMERCFVNIERYGNMSSATVPVALVEALEAGRVAPGANLLLTGFGAGLTWSAHVLKWGERTTPLGTSDAELPPCTKSALEMVRGYIAVKRARGYGRLTRSRYSATKRSAAPATFACQCAAACSSAPSLTYFAQANAAPASLQAFASA